jgi:hypothetical protein
VVKVILATTANDAHQVRDRVATVEATYGETTVTGKKYTLCDLSTHKVFPIDSGNIVISHIDLGTLKWLSALMGNPISSNSFWDSALYISRVGSHHIRELDRKTRSHLLAYWAFAEPIWSKELHGDVTSLVKEHLDFLEQVLLFRNKELIEKGKRWDQQRRNKIEACLIEEDRQVRVFVTSQVFCNAAYDKPDGTIVPVIVTFNTSRRTIVVSCEGNQINCEAVVKKVWGPDAGESLVSLVRQEDRA